MSRQVLTNIKTIYTVDGGVKGGHSLAEFRVLQDGYLVVEDELIVAIGEGDYDDFDTDCDGCKDSSTIFRDMQGRIVTPGLIDCHTHLVHGGNRVHEYALKLQKVPYLDILKQGGGILSTVAATRAASFEELFDKASHTLAFMLSCGVTTVEAKSGYGLDRESEVKQLLVTKKLAQTQSVELVSTYMGAHAIPTEYTHNKEGYLALMIEEVMPYIKQEALATFVDIFCEEGIFEIEDSRRVLEAAQRLGFSVKIHADEIVALGGANLAAELGCVSAEHLMKAKSVDLAWMVKQGVVGVVLPTTSFHLNHPYANVALMKELDMVLALASDYNPGSSPCSDLLWAMRIGSRGYQLAPKELLSMVCINAAKAIHLDHKVGSIEVGKQADLVFFDADSFDEVIVRMGENPVSLVMKKGVVVYERSIVG